MRGMSQPLCSRYQSRWGGVSAYCRGREDRGELQGVDQNVVQSSEMNAQGKLIIRDVLQEGGMSVGHYNEESSLKAGEVQRRKLGPRLPCRSRGMPGGGEGQLYLRGICWMLGDEKKEGEDEMDGSAVASWTV